MLSEYVRSPGDRRAQQTLSLLDYNLRSGSMGSELFNRIWTDLPSLNDISSVNSFVILATNEWENILGKC
jgi:hypothetical protein